MAAKNQPFNLKINDPQNYSQKLHQKKWKKLHFTHVRDIS
jgi:hypothetical protein